MIRITLFIIVLNAFTANGQTLKEAKKALKNVEKVEQIDELKARYPDWDILVDKTMLSDSTRFPDIIAAKTGDVLLKQYSPKAPTFVIKIMQDREEELCKVKYIYLNGDKLSKSEIDSLRTIIVNRYNKGDDFETLVKAYTMDGNPTGDLPWFYKGMMAETFDNAVRPRKKGEIFTVDVSENKWYYVVLKDEDNKMTKAKISVVIKYNK
jgi:hypothetical protein